MSTERPRRKPVVDGRRREDVLRYVRETAPAYTDRWSPESADAGTAIASLFAEMVEDVTERLDRLPEKHFISFLETVGFDRRPPQSARLPLTFELADGVDRNIAVPARTQAVAEATESRPESTFEVDPGDGFEATPATLVGAYSVDPTADQLFDHLSALSEGRETTLFGGEDVQSHALYLGHTTLLDLKDETTIRVEFGVSSSVAGHDRSRILSLLDRLEWEYYGKKDDEEGWHELPDVDGTSEPPMEATLVREAVNRLEPELTAYGYERVPLATPERSALIERITVDVFNRGLLLPDHLIAASTVNEGLAERVRRAFGDVRRTFDEATTRSGNAVRSFELDGTPTETTVGDVTSRWLRASIPDERVARPLFDAAFESIKLDVRPPQDGRPPDALFANDVPLPVPDSEQITIRPFGELPQLYDTFYIASDEAFTKRGSRVTLTFTGETETDPKTEGADSEVDPTLSWEFWNGSGWAYLDLEEDDDGKDDDGKDALFLNAKSSVSFVVPDDLEPTSVMGRTASWIRVRLVAGDYGDVYYEEETQKQEIDGRTVEVPTGKWIQKTDRVDEPAFTDVRVVFGSSLETSPTTLPEHLITDNALDVEEVRLAEGVSAPIRPFKAVLDDSQTLYLAFDEPLDDGPLHLFVSPIDREYPDGFYPRVRWEYCTDPARDRWEPPSVVDGSESLTERGIVKLVFPEATVATERFGRTAYWLRGRLAGDPFVGTLYRPTSASSRSDPAEHPVSPCRATVPTLPPAGYPSKRPPTLSGLYPNTTWASNVRTASAERIGASDGTPLQSFTIADPPIIDVEIWIDELEALSEEQRRTLADERPDATEAERGPSDEIRRFWVRWTAVEDFLDSGPADRHYELDRTAGTVTFGDGVAGRIPPAGAVRATYRTGGGAAGNVPVGSVSSLVSSIAFVDGVTNPEPADGGADAETTTEVLDRGPNELRDRNRAVAPVDFERLALAASRKIARSKCLPAMDRGGAYRPGWVTLLIVPRSDQRSPAPSAELRERVGTFIEERAAATLVNPDRLVVRGPSYVATTVETTVVARSGASIASLEAAITESLTAFLHPLTGGPTGDGWACGELPCRADFYERLEGIPDVDHVRTLAVRFHGTNRVVTAVEGDDPPNVSEDALVYSGSHDVSAVGGR